MVGSRGKGDGERLARRTCGATAGTTKRTPAWAAAGAAQQRRTARRRSTASQSPPPRTVARNACEIAAWKWSLTIRQRRIVQLRKGTISERIHWPRFCLWQKEVEGGQNIIFKKYWDVFFWRSFLLCRVQARSRDRVSILGAWKGQSPGDPTGILTYHPASSSLRKKMKNAKNSESVLQVCHSYYLWNVLRLF